MKMVTTYNPTDMVDFGQFCAELVQNGMLFPNEKISKSQFENWKLSKSLKYSVCPKALSTAQMLTYQTVGFNRDALSNRVTLGRAKGTIAEACSEGVIVVYPVISANGNVMRDSEGKPKIGVYPENTKGLVLAALSIREERSDFPYAHVSVPFAQFPIHEFGKVTAFGACFHASDLGVTQEPRQNKAVVNSPDCA
jgi:hypothetical protein